MIIRSPVKVAALAEAMDAGAGEAWKPSRRVRRAAPWERAGDNHQAERWYRLTARIGLVADLDDTAFAYC
jgi:hypothetical protein